MAKKLDQAGRGYPSWMTKEEIVRAQALAELPKEVRESPLGACHPQWPVGVADDYGNVVVARAGS